MNQGKHNNHDDLTLLIPNIDTTTERLSSDNNIGIFFKNTLTDKSKINTNVEILKTNNTEKKIQKYSDNSNAKSMRGTPNNYSNIKNNCSSQKETQEMTQQKTNKTSKKNMNKSLINPQKSENYRNIVKKINMISVERTKKKEEHNSIKKIPKSSKKIISNITDTDNKDSYIYLIKLKKNYSSNKLKDENSTYINIRQKTSKDKNINKKNLTLNDFYSIKKNLKKQEFSSFSPKPKKVKKVASQGTSKTYKEIDNSCNRVSKVNKNRNAISNINRNNSFSPCNQINMTNNNISNINDFTEIKNVRKKFNETCKHFYNNHQNNIKYSNLMRNLTENNNFKKINVNKPKIKESNNLYTTSDYSSVNSYWNKRGRDEIKKMAQIKNDLFLKEENEIQLVPKISQKSKNLAAANSAKYNIEFNNIYDRLFYINNLNLNLNIDGENDKNHMNTQYQPAINEKSKNIKRTIDDLYSWQKEKERKRKMNEDKIFKETVYNKKNINLSSEEILKERRPNYTKKKVEDRLIEQGKNQKIKNEMEKEKNFENLTEKKTFVNNNFNNIKSRYLEQKGNNMGNNNENRDKVRDRDDNFNQNENIQNNLLAIANMRNFDNFNKKMSYYGDKLNTNSYYNFNKLNKSLNKTNKNAFTSRSSDKIKSFSSNNINNNNININNNSSSKNNNLTNLTNLNDNSTSNNTSNLFNCNYNYNINQFNHRTSMLNSRIPKDFNKISRPPSSKNYFSQKNYTLGFSHINNLSTPQILLDKTSSINNYNTSKENNQANNKEKYVLQNKFTFSPQLYNNTNYNYNSENNNNNIVPNGNIDNNINELNMNLNNNINNISNINKNELSLSSYLSNNNNNKNYNNISEIAPIQRRIEEINNNDINKEFMYSNNNNNTGKFYINGDTNIKSNNFISNNNNINLKEYNNIRRDSERINSIENNNINVNNIFNNNRKQNSVVFNTNSDLNQITYSLSSSNTSKIDRRDRRKEDLMKIINFSDNLYGGQIDENLISFDIK